MQESSFTYHAAIEHNARYNNADSLKSSERWCNPDCVSISKIESFALSEIRDQVWTQIADCKERPLWYDQ